MKMSMEHAIQAVAANLGVENPADYLDIPEDWRELADIANEGGRCASLID
jgi:hypothetical protein